MHGETVKKGRCLFKKLGDIHKSAKLKCVIEIPCNKELVVYIKKWCECCGAG
jgi:hypothetical protein